MHLDEATLRQLWPAGDSRVSGLIAGIVQSSDRVFAAQGITTPLLVAHVMAQISHECGAGRDVVENLNYSAGRMMQVWPSRFPSMAGAAPFAGRPQALANKVYNGRMGNAAGSDDGWDFRGRGAVQTTGREGYARLARATGIDVVAHPDLVNDPRHFLPCGVADFVLCGCLPFARADDIHGVTVRLNGGTVGLAARKAWLGTWKAALRDVALTRVPTITALPPLAPAQPSPKPTALSSFIAAFVAAFRRA